MEPTGADPDHLNSVRRHLHTLAEPSGAEKRTAAYLKQQLSQCQPDELLQDLGGHGVAAVFVGRIEGPTVLLRSDTDALPLPDRTDLEWASTTANVAHKCGHDGHMTMLLGLARELSRQRPARGRAVLLFQPAEENGAGARRVLDDPAFDVIRPDRVLGVHNLPGFPLGSVILRAGTFASASRGLTIELEGASSHAAEPHRGRSPVPAAAALCQALAALPQQESDLNESAQATVVGVEVGGPAFGTSPGSGRVMATLRSHGDAVMERLVDRCRQLAENIARAHGLECRLHWSEEFPATVSHAAVVEHLRRDLAAGGHDIILRDAPFAWSEDFGHFTAAFPGALVGLGAGEDQPALHHPDYDFPDNLLPRGVAFWRRALDSLLVGPETEGENS